MKNRYAKVFYDELCFNHQLRSRSLYQACHYIYVVREPAVSLPLIVGEGYTDIMALNYYCFRLRRLCEMAQKKGTNFHLSATTVPILPVSKKAGKNSR